MAFTPHFKVRLLNKQHPQPYRLINEAFVVFDTMVARVALTRGGNTPPAAPVNGEVHIIGTAPVDIWAGMGACITYYFNGWQFIAPPPRMKMWVVEEGIFITYTGTLWSVDAGTSDAQNDQTSTLSGSSTLLSSDSQQPSIITEWLDPDGTRVAPFTGTARECVVVYLMDGERRILTPFSDYHFRAPRLAYGGKSVIAWRVANGAEDKTGKRFAISVGCPGFMAPDDPNLLHVWMCDGQSLAVGSQGSDEYPWRTKNNWPEHLLVLQNTMIPGDSRLGRDAQKVDYVLSRETLTGFTPVSPRVGFRRNHGFTPLEGLALTMQHDIVEKLGRPQRIALAILGIGGAAIAALSPGAENYKNYETVMDAMVEEAAVRGWKVSFDFDLWIQGESDVGGVNGSSAAYRSVYDARLDAIRAKASAI